MTTEHLLICWSVPLLQNPATDTSKHLGLWDCLKHSNFPRTSRPCLMLDMERDNFICSRQRRRQFQADLCSVNICPDYCVITFCAPGEGSRDGGYPHTSGMVLSHLAWVLLEASYTLLVVLFTHVWVAMLTRGPCGSSPGLALSL